MQPFQFLKAADTTQATQGAAGAGTHFLAGGTNLIDPHEGGGGRDAALRVGEPTATTLDTRWQLLGRLGHGDGYLSSQAPEGFGLGSLPEGRYCRGGFRVAGTGYGYVHGDVAGCQRCARAEHCQHPLPAWGLCPAASTRLRWLNDGRQRRARDRGCLRAGSLGADQERDRGSRLCAEGCSGRRRERRGRLAHRQASPRQARACRRSRGAGRCPDRGERRGGARAGEQAVRHAFLRRRLFASSPPTASAGC